MTEILSIYPPKEWFIEIVNEESEVKVSNDIILTMKTIIVKVYSCDDLESCKYDLNILYHLAWEQINVGIFKDVSLKWRKLFGISCLLLAYVNLKSMKSEDVIILKKCLYLCDMSLMMGGELKKDFNLGSLLASTIHSIISQMNGLFIKQEQLLSKRQFDPYEFIPVEIQDNVRPLNRISAPSVTEFLQILRDNCPVILTNSIDHWLALSKWSVGFIKHLCGYRTVPVEIGSTYAHADWTQKLMTINEFIDEYFYESSDKSNQKAYMAQHYLFSQISELFDDIEIPHYCSINGDHDDEEIDSNAWFGPSGTVSPLHQDPKHNLLCQVFGEKYVKLYCPSESEYLYPNSTTMLNNTSRVDVYKPDLHSFPLFSKAKGYDGFLKPGEILFIPPKCWHYVTSISASFSVNFWWNYI